MVTVVITTNNRPEYLREALVSVQGQTARQRIGQVIVSENSLSDASAEVCRQFNDLPMSYLSQRPPVPPQLHLKGVWKHVQHPLVAFLHDDDWWTPEHLGAAVGVLDSQPNCAAVFSNFYETNGPSFPAQVSSEKAWRIWVGAGCNFSEPVLTIHPVSAALICLLDSNFHYSTAVGRAEAIWDAYLKIVATGNSYDTDRLFGVFLSTHGTLSYVTRPDVFVRIHPGQDSMHQRNFDSGWAKKAETTRWLLRSEPEMIARAIEQFNTSARSLPPVLLRQLVRDIGEPQLRTLIQDCGLQLEMAPTLPPPPRNAKWLLKQICPPVILALRRRLEEHLKHT